MGLAWALAVNSTVVGFPLCLLLHFSHPYRGTHSVNLLPQRCLWARGQLVVGMRAPGLPSSWDFHHKLRVVASHLGLQLTAALN